MSSIGNAGIESQIVYHRSILALKKCVIRVNARIGKTVYLEEMQALDL